MWQTWLCYLAIDFSPLLSLLCPYKFIHHSLPVCNILCFEYAGAVAFVRSISLEAVGLGVHLAAGAHDLLRQTECILTSGSSSVPRNINKRSVQSNQPRNARQGMLQVLIFCKDFNCDYFSGCLNCVFICLLLK